MRTIITGGTGLIGRALATSLASEGEVVVLSRRPERAGDWPAGVRVEAWDGCTARGWGKLANGARAIVNLAGENLAAGRWTAARKGAIRQSRLLAGQAVAEAVAAATDKPGVLIQASAVGYYGPRGDEPVTEAAQAGRDFLAKMAEDWEASTERVEAAGVRRAIIRTGVVLSTRGGALPRMLLPFRFFVGGPLGNGQQWFPWIHLADHVAAIRFLIQDPQARGPFNLAAPNAVTNAQFSRILGDVLGRPAGLPAPAFVLRSVFGEMVTVLLDGQRLVPQRLLERGFMFRFPDVRLALIDLLR